MHDTPLTEKSRGPRLAFIDNLRLFLTALVVLVHASVTYGGEGSWYYKEGGATEAERIALTLLNALCQCFFMGLFFFLAGYFTPGAYDRKGAAGFLRDRLFRLGIPLLAFDLLLEPLTLYIRQDPEIAGRPLPELYLSYLRHKEGIGAGPLWFVELLLLFSLAYAAWRSLVPSSGGRSAEAPPRARSILLFACSLGLATFAVRLRFPIGSFFAPMNVQPPFLPSYLAAFPLGVLAWRRGWLEPLSAPGRRGAGAAAAVAIVALPVLFLASGAAAGPQPFLGGARWQALGLALWESLAGVSISLFLLRALRAGHHQGWLARECARSAYTVYIIHAPILVLVTTRAHGIPVPSLAKFAAAWVLALSLCFLAAGGIRRLPGFRRIL